MSTSIMKPSARAQARGALERVDQLEARVGQIEAALPQVMAAIDNALNVQRNQLSHTAEIVDALVGLVGEENVISAVNDNRVKKAQAMADARRQAMVQKLEAGELVAEETIRGVTSVDGNITDPGSYVESMEYDESGAEVPGSYYCLPMTQIKPDFQAQLVGQKVGFSVQTTEPKKDADGNPVLGADGQPACNKVVILGVYKPAAVAKPAPDAPAQEVVAPTQASAEPAAQASAE